MAALVDTLQTRRVLAVASLACALALVGCGVTPVAPAVKTPEPAAYKPSAPVLGPFPANVSIQEGNVRFSVESILLQPADAHVEGRMGGYPGPQPGEQVKARAGHRFAHITVVEWDTSIPAKPVWPFDGRKGIVATITASADGKRVPVLAHMLGGAQKDPSKLTHDVQIEVPIDSAEALLYITPSEETSGVLAFQLW